eukprot:625267-Lingulodinium_polyedra.AAC.1
MVVQWRANGQAMANQWPINGQAVANQPMAIQWLLHGQSTTAHPWQINGHSMASQWPLARARPIASQFPVNGRPPAA